MKKDILIIDTPFVGYPSNNRSNYIPQLLKDQGYIVEKVSSDFNHFTKQIEKAEDYSNASFKISLLPTIAYEKNLSLNRYLSQKIFARNLKKYLSERNVPDLIYNFVPSLDVALIVAKYAKKNNVKYVIDVRDLWPEAFKMVIKNSALANILFYPMNMKANKIYSSADGIIAVSDTYKERALKQNTKNIEAHTVYLGADLDLFDFNERLDFLSQTNNKKIKMVYTGTLGHSYNLPLIFDAMYILKKKGFFDIQLTVIGNGPLEQEFKNNASEKEIDVLFTGRLSYIEVVKHLQRSDIAVNPIVPLAAQSIINKHADYAAAGLPVINTQNSEEYRSLIDEHNFGLNTSSDPNDVAEALICLIENPTLRFQMSLNHRKLAEESFCRKTNYTKITGLIDNLLNR